VLISVIIPSYNHAAFLPAALQSVYDQTFAEIEVVIVDDASSDASVPTVRKILHSRAWRKRFPRRSQLLEQTTNKGAHCAINSAIKHSEGDYIAILNSDDVFRRDRLEKMISNAATTSGFIFSECWYLDEMEKSIPVLDDRTRPFWEIQKRIPDYPTTGFSFLGANAAITTGNLLFSRRLYEEVGPFSNLRYCHDWHFALRAILYAEPVYVDIPLYGYRLHRGNSFYGLSKVAKVETQICRQAFLAASPQATSEVAPTERNWHAVFESIAEWTGLFDVMVGGSEAQETADESTARKDASTAENPQKFAGLDFLPDLPAAIASVPRSVSAVNYFDNIDTSDGFETVIGPNETRYISGWVIAPGVSVNGESPLVVVAQHQVSEKSYFAITNGRRERPDVSEEFMHTYDESETRFAGFEFAVSMRDLPPGRYSLMVGVPSPLILTLGTTARSILIEEEPAC
jgi:glycosyltransferase involved in cell wall biosynthesis